MSLLRGRYVQGMGISRQWICPEGVGMSGGTHPPPFDMGPGIQRETVDKQVVSILNKCLNFEKKRNGHQILKFPLYVCRLKFHMMKTTA